MFGMNDQNQQSNDDPAMLDNVKQLASQPASQVAPSDPVTADPVASDPQSINEHKAEPAQGFSSTATPFTPAQPLTATTPINDNGAADAGIQTDDSTNPAETTEAAAQTPYQAPTITGHSKPMGAPTPPPASIDDRQSSNQADDQPSGAAVSTPSTVTPEPLAAVTPSQPADPTHLSGLKQEALTHLESLTDHITGTPEETFKTTMMMIQANDNHTLLEKALEAAKMIEDDKVRAKALLDIINEINYFSSLQQQN